MALVEIRSHNIWIKHVSGNTQLVRKLTALQEGQTIMLAVDGHTGEWEKMRNGTGGHLPTQGLKPVGKAREHWHSLQSRRGKTVKISESSESGRLVESSPLVQKVLKPAKAREAARPNKAKQVTRTSRPLSPELLPENALRRYRVIKD